ncbi:hypothetical protein BDF14DRAFT_1723625 [Spinellus fusiger]|nr:hypothetical protein BDF14DRAFT_1723625 [Spinellus fusiger]
MSQTIRPYQASDNEYIQKIYLEKARKDEISCILKVMMQNSKACWSFPISIIALVSYELTAVTSLKNLLITIGLKSALLSTSIGLAWFFYFRKDYWRANNKYSQSVLRELTTIKCSKSGTWVMEKEGRILGVVGLRYEEEEGKLQSLTAGDSHVELALVQKAIQFARKKDIKVITQRGKNTAWPNAAFGIALLTLARHDVELSVVPSQLGHLTRLTFLDLSNNRICQLPNSTCELKHLRHLNISNNLFKETPNAIPFLSKLMHLDMSYNPLEELSADIAQLNNLTMLDLTSTNIRNVPYEILRVNPLSIKVDDCPNIAERHMSFKASLQYNPPSLLETCARILIRPLLIDSSSKKKRVGKKALENKFSLIPPNIKGFLSNPKACSYCEGPYYDACVFRYRIVHRSDSTYLPIEYRLCSAHWSNEKDRIVAMFSTPPSTTLPRYKKGRELRYTIPSL